MEMHTLHRLCAQKAPLQRRRIVGFRLMVSQPRPPEPGGGERAGEGGAERGRGEERQRGRGGREEGTQRGEEGKERGGAAFPQDCVAGKCSWKVFQAAELRVVILAGMPEKGNGT